MNQYIIPAEAAPPQQGQAKKFLSNLGFNPYGEA